MGRRRMLKMVHLAGMAWFVFCAAYLAVFSLRQAGTSWLVILSLSGYSMIFGFLLISLYLFAIFRGASRNQKIQIEHPLTTSNYYLRFYDVSPFLGIPAGVLGTIGLSSVANYFIIIATGSLWTTFFIWIIIDPLAGISEMMLPLSRKHREIRLAEAKAIRDQENQSKQRMLETVHAEYESEKSKLAESLEPYAGKLAGIAASVECAGEWRENEAVDIGLAAWRLGGINCMKQLYSMSREICKAAGNSRGMSDYISVWWDGIGSWHGKRVEEK